MIKMTTMTITARYAGQTHDADSIQDALTYAYRTWGLVGGDEHESGSEVGSEYTTFLYETADAAESDESVRAYGSIVRRRTFACDGCGDSYPVSAMRNPPEGGSYCPGCEDAPVDEDD